MAMIAVKELSSNPNNFARLPMLYGTISCLPMKIVVGFSLVAPKVGKRSEQNTHGNTRRGSRKQLTGWKKTVGVQYIIRRVGNMWICNKCNKEWGVDDFAPDLCECGGEVKFIEPQTMIEVNKVLDDAFQKVFGEKW